MLNISSLQCQLAAAFQDEALFQIARANAAVHPLVQQQKLVRQLCNYYDNEADYYMSTHQYKRAYTSIQQNLARLEETTMPTLKRHVLEQYTALADQVGEDA